MRTIMAIVTVFSACHANSLSAYADPALMPRVAETAVTPRQSAAARVALDAMRLSLRAVRSGTCRMHFRYQYDPNQEGEGEHSHAGENLFIAFDKEQNLYRYDDLESRYSGRPDQNVVRLDFVLSLPGDWTIKSDATHSRMIVRRSRGDVEHPFRRHRDPFVTVLADCGSNRMNQTHHGFLDRLLDETIPTSTIVSHDKTDTDLVRMTFRKNFADTKVTVEYEMTLKTTQGYVPMGVRLRHNGTISGAWTEPDVIENEWTPTNGVFVPTRSHSKGTYGKKSVLTFEMAWEHVNEPLPSALFTEEAFDPQKGDMMTVAKADQFVIEKIVGVEPPKLPAKQPDPPPRYWRFALILLANALAYGGWLYSLRRRRRASGKSEAV